jgi:hypothetical protein
MTRIASGWFFFLAPAVAHFMWMTRGGNEAKVVFSENPNEADQKMFLEMIASRTSLRVGVAPASSLKPLSFALKALPGETSEPTHTVRVDLSAPGERYFVCSVGAHCPKGQRVRVVVRDLAAGGEARVIRVGGTDGWIVKAYEDILANVGDTLNFSWQATHNVEEVPTAEAMEACDFSSRTMLGSSRGPPGELVSDPLPKKLLNSAAVLEGEATWGVFPELKPTSPPLLRYWFSAHSARSQKDWAFVDAQSRNRLGVSIRVQRCNYTTGAAEAEVVARFDGARLSRAEVSLFDAEGNRAGSVNTSEAGDAYVVLPLGKPAYAMVNFDEQSNGMDRGKAYEAVAHYATHAASVDCPHAGQDIHDAVHAIRRHSDSYFGIAGAALVLAAFMVLGISRMQRFGVNFSAREFE